MAYPTYLQGMSDASIIPSIEQETSITREQWLERAVKVLEPLFTEAGLKLPAVRVSTGFPSKKALSMKNRAIGECWHKDGVNQEYSHLFISPLIDDQNRVLDVLIHELLHAALPAGTSHNKTFAVNAHRLGLEGKPTATVASEQLIERLNEMFKGYLPYPHRGFDAWLSKKKKQSARLRLYECQCPVKVRVASDDFQAHCDNCRLPFECKQKDDSGE